jgi:hypothetical protein
MAFTKARKEQGRLRLAISSPAGYGKTYTALRIARRLAEHYGGRVALIDTEHGSASKYASKFDFDCDELHPPFEPERYIAKIKEAEAAGYKVLVIDSGSHEWNGEGGCLEIKDTLSRTKFSGNSWSAWSEVTPRHNRFTETILGSSMHIIATYRSKAETTQVQEGGRTKVKKLGMEAIAREGTDFEFDVVGEMDDCHRMQITKTRCEALTDREFPLPGEDVADILIAWLSDGAPVELKPASQPTPAPAQPSADGAEPTAAQPVPEADKRTLLLDWWKKQLAKTDKKPIEPMESFVNRHRAVRDSIMGTLNIDTGQYTRILQVLTGKSASGDLSPQELRMLESMVDAHTVDRLTVLLPEEVPAQTT